MTTFKNYFYGNKISEYGLENGYVDYRTFAQAFEAVLNNEIINKTLEIGYWEQTSGFINNTDEIEELEEKIQDLENKIEELEEIEPENENQEEQINGEVEDLENKIDILQDRKQELEEEQDEQPEIYQYYIIDDNGARICEEFNEIVFYNEELDLYVWGVTHWGTSWDYVLTNIKCEKPVEELPFKI